MHHKLVNERTPSWKKWIQSPQTRWWAPSHPENQTIRSGSRVGHLMIISLIVAHPSLSITTNWPWIQSASIKRKKSTISWVNVWSSQGREIEILPWLITRISTPDMRVFHKHVKQPWVKIISKQSNQDSALDDLLQTRKLTPFTSTRNL